MAKSTRNELKLGMQTRAFDLSRGTFNKEKRTVEVQFSSEEPVSRWFGEEILDHSDSSVDMRRMNNGAAVLMEHDTRMGCGVIEKASISNRKGTATVRFAKNQFGEQCMSEVEDGTLRFLSVGYRVHKFEVDDNEENYRAIRWEPMEVSFVRIPADPSCKVHRSENNEEKEVTLMFKRHIQHDKADTTTAGGGGGVSITSDEADQRYADIREIAMTALKWERNYPDVKALAEAAMNEKVPDKAAFYRKLMDLKFKPSEPEVLVLPGGNPTTTGDIGHGIGGRCHIPIGQRFVESDSYKKAMRLPKGTRRVEMFDNEHYSFRQDHEMMVRTTFSASGQSISGTSGNNIMQLQGVNVLNQQPLYVSDLFSQGTTSGDIVRFIIEDTYTNSAARVSEGSAKPEATLDVSVASVTVEKTATWLKVTEEMLEDFEQMQSFINGRLAYMVQALEDGQLLTGSGSSQIKGVLNWTGIQTVSGAIGTIDALCKAVDYVRGANGVGFANPTAIIMHPLDWLNVRLTKDANGQYLLGGPTFGAYGVGGFSNVAMAWGLPVVSTTSITRGTALTGDFRMGGQIFRRKGLTLATTNSDNDDFQKNLITIRAEQRMTLAIYQPNRFCSVTGIPA